jgi:hypothetical protein
MSQSRIGIDQFSLAALTPDELAELRGAQAGRLVPVAGMAVTPIDYDWGSPATAGLWRVDLREMPNKEVQVASFFVKLLRHPRLWPALSLLPEESRPGFLEFFPWRFELDMYESGIAETLPPGLRMPVLHTAKHIDADHIALWFEYIEQQPGRWGLADYRRAAYLLGRLAARRRDGADVNESLPAVCRVGLPGESLRFYFRGRLMEGALPALRDPAFWRHPSMEQALRHVDDRALPGDMLELAERLPAILDLIAALPQTHAHGDASPQNLLRPAGEPGTLIIIDWGFGDLLPIGFDLGQLLVGLAHAGETDPGELQAIDAAIMPGYLDGLADEGYEVDPGLVRAGYLGGLAVRSALCALPLERLSQPAQTGEELALVATRLRLTRVMVDLAAEVEADVLARMPTGR